MTVNNGYEKGHRNMSWKERTSRTLRKVPPDGLFLVAFVLMCCAYEYGRVLHLRPQPHHIWRQTIGLSITKNLYEGTATFWEPQIDALFLDEGHTGKGVGESPVLYYAVAQLWRITGPSEFVYRAFMLLLHFLGSYALFRMLRTYMIGAWWPLFVASLFFTSPAIVYFAISFMTEVPALDLLLVAGWMLVRYQRTRRSTDLVLAGMLLGLAGTLKLTAAMSIVALLLAWLAERIFPEKSKSSGRLFDHPGPSLAMLLLSAMSVAGWYIYSLHYNELHGGGFSNQFAQPLWSLDADVAERAWEFGKLIMPGQIFHWSVWVLLAGSLVVIAAHASRLPPALLALNGSLVVGAIAFMLLWFVALDNHDYYFILPSIAVVLPIATAIRTLQSSPGSSAWTHRAVLPAAALLMVNVFYARENMEFRTRGEREPDRRGWMFHHSKAELDHWDITRYWHLNDLLTIEHYARSIGIERSDTVVVMPDHTVCAGLYLSGQRGWQNLGTKGSLEDSASIAGTVINGARFLYVTDTALLKRPYLRSFLSDPVGRYGATRIYRLK